MAPAVFVVILVFLVTTFEEQVREAHIPVVSICAATRSLPGWSSVDETSLQRILLPSIERSVSLSNRNKFLVRLYLAADSDDLFWRTNASSLVHAQWLDVRFGFFEKKSKHRVPFNEMMRWAYDEGSDYLVRINDDTEFVTSNWTERGVEKLASYDPPNLGVVGPTCRQGRTVIMTHDMVHRTHMLVFDMNYYPPVFSAWFIDDWISQVYGQKRTTKLASWEVKHHTTSHGRRYRAQRQELKLLPAEVAKGTGRIQRFLASQKRPK